MSEWDSLYGWGSGSFGRLGVGVAEADLAPERIGGILNGRTVQASACGWYHSLVCTAEGEVLTFGSNVTHALGLPSDSEDDSPRCARRRDEGGRDSKRAFLPTLVPFPRKVQVVQVSCSGDMLGAHSLAVTRHGRLFAWGYGPACGCGTSETVKTPTAVTRFLGTGGAHGPKPEERTWSRRVRWQKPQKTLGMRALNPKIVKAASGAGFSVCQSAEGEVFSWGLSASGRLGYRTKFRAQLRPRRIETLKDGVTDIAAGGAFSLICTAQGRVCSFGDNSKGQLGLGHLQDTYEPTTVSKASSAFYRVACGDSHSMALDVKGKVSTWGGGGGAATGDGRPLPSEQLLVHALQFNLKDIQFWWTRPNELLLEDILVICTGFSHSLALSKDALYAWGSPLQAGHAGEAAESCWIPRLLAPSPILPLVSVTSCSAGGWHSLLTAKPHTALHVLKEERAARYLDGVITCKGGAKVLVSTAGLRCRLTTDGREGPIWSKVRYDIDGIKETEEEMELSDIARTVQYSCTHNADEAAGGKIEERKSSFRMAEKPQIQKGKAPFIPLPEKPTSKKPMGKRTKAAPEWSSDSSSDSDDDMMRSESLFSAFNERVVTQMVHFLYTDTIDVEIDGALPNEDSVLSTAEAHQLRALGQKLGLERLVRALDQEARYESGAPPLFLPNSTLAASMMNLFRETFDRSVAKTRNGVQTGPDTMVACQKPIDAERWTQFSSGGPNLCCHAFVLEASTKCAIKPFDDDLWIVQLPFPVDVMFIALCLLYTGEVCYHDLVQNTVEWHSSLLHLAIHLDSPTLIRVAHDMVLGILSIENWARIAELGEKLKFPQLKDAAVCCVLRRVAQIALQRVRADEEEAQASHSDRMNLGGHQKTQVDEFLLNLDLPGTDSDISEMRHASRWLYLILRNKLDEFLKADEKVRERLRNYADFLSKTKESPSANIPWKEVLALLALLMFFSSTWSQEREVWFRSFAPWFVQEWADSFILSTTGSYVRLVFLNIAFVSGVFLVLYIGLGK